jgi:CRP-like cAMP-binding protein
MNSTRAQKSIGMLKGIKLFSSCTTSELKRILSLTVALDVPEGTVLAHEDTPGFEFFIIVSGTATVYRRGRQLADLDAGSFFGEMALLDGGYRTATVIARTDLSVLVLSQREFKSLQAFAPTVAHNMLAEMGRRLRLANDLVEADRHHYEPR